MFKPQLLRSLAAAAAATRTTPKFTPPSAAALRSFSRSIARNDKESDPHDAASTAGEPGESGDHEGSFARTDRNVRVEYPEEKDLPSSKPVQGRGGLHYKRTLAAFSLEGNVGVVTGGARGLGLIMAQALVVSGANVALVDMNSEWHHIISNRSIVPLLIKFL